MSVRICEAPPVGDSDKDFVRVQTCPDPLDDTATLVTIERIVEMPQGLPVKEPTRRVRALIKGQRMPADVALGLATRYAERKRIPVVYTHELRQEDDNRTTGNADNTKDADNR